jgi:hypothetical protein
MEQSYLLSEILDERKCLKTSNTYMRFINLEYLPLLPLGMHEAISLCMQVAGITMTIEPG